MSRSNKDIMYDFLQDPSREKFVDLVLNGDGEQNNLDFKEKWIEYQKISELILGIANSGGGTIIFGISELSDGTFENKGLDKLEDKANIESKVRKFLPDVVKFEVLDFDFSGEVYSKLKNKLFQVMMIYSENELLPYIWNKDSNDSEIGTVFIRRGTKTCKANGHELKELIEKRIRSTYSEGSSLELKEHLGQLKVLYESINRNKTNYTWANNLGNALQGLISPLAAHITTEENVNYPKEEFEEFICRMISQKKIKIEKVLDLK